MDRPTKGFFKIIYLSSTCVSGLLHCLQEVKQFISVFTLIYIVATVLLSLLFFLIPGFVFANFPCLCGCSCPCMCIYFWVFCFSFITLLPPK